MIICNNAQEFVECIADKKILIYGTGYVAHIFLEALKKRKLEKQIQGFVVSCHSRSVDEIEGIPVNEIEEILIDEDTVVCIAVHESFKLEIELTIVKRGWKNYIWIYPYLYNLYYGAPIRVGEPVEIGKLVSRDTDRYNVALRWAAIDNYYGKCSQGFYLYRKAMALHANMRTAEARKESFKKLIQSCDEFGYDDKKQIIINDVYEIIDGEHRVTVGLYHGKQKIGCTVYLGENLHSEKVLFTKRVLLEGGFTKEEMDILDHINLIIKDLIS